MPKGEPIDGVALRQEIESRGWTVEEAAGLIGMSYGRLKHLVGRREQMATERTRMKILRALSAHPPLPGTEAYSRLFNGEVLGSGDRAED